MALILKDRVQETGTANTTVSFTLAGAVAGFQSFSVIGNGNTTYYTIAAQSGGEWEVGIGTYTSSGTLLSRDSILSSSNANAIVNFSSGTKDVFVTYPSEAAALGGAGQAILLSQTTINSSYTIASGTNEFTIGPVTLANGTSVTVTGGQRWVVI